MKHYHGFIINREDQKKTKIPKYARTFAIADGGTVFIPAAVGGDEYEVYLCTHSDAIPSLLHKDHYYVPVEWLKKNFPKSKKDCEIFEDFANIEMSE